MNNIILVASLAFSLPYYTISDEHVEKAALGLHLSYPQFTSPAGIQHYIDDFIRQKVFYYFDEYRTGNSLYITYEAFLSANRCGLLFYNSIDFQGAHPLTTIQTFNFYENHTVNTAQLFSQKDYQMISSLCREQLSVILHQSQMYVEDMFLPGTAPVAANFANVIIADDAYTFYFEQYQIAPYAAGILSINIPKYKL